MAVHSGSPRTGPQSVMDRFMRQHGAVRQTQQTLLESILRRNAATAFGREHGFRTVRTVEEYRRQVPIRSWLEISPYVDAIVAGQQNVLTKEPPFFYHRTSGTTGKPKMIPFTRRCEAASKLTHRLWIYRNLADNPTLLQGRVMAILNAAIEGYTERREAYGAVSGNVYFRMPPIIRRAYSHPYDVYEIKSPEARRYTLLRFAVEQDCTFVFTGNPSSMLAIFEFGDRYGETLIRDIHDGTLATRFDVPDHVRAIALNELLPNPRRARALARARERAGRLRPVEYWPQLSVLGCWIGGSMGHFAPQLREWCGEGFRFRDVGYMASEGIFSVPIGNDSPDGLLALHAIYFEFVPEHEFGRPGARSLLAHEIEPDRNYHVVITTSGGLYRYAMNDVVRVAAMHEGSPLIRFIYKGGNVKNLQGEMVSIDHVMGTMSALTAELDLRLRHFQVAAELGRSCYVLHVEPLNDLPPAVLPRILSGFERELGRINENYAMFRADRLIGPPRLCVMRKGWFDRISQDHVARSSRDSQFKPAVLVDGVEHSEMIESSVDLSS